MKKAAKIFIVFLVFCLMAIPALAGSQSIQATVFYRNIKIMVDGEEMTPTNVDGNATEPFIIDGTTYLPVRAISEALGCYVGWDDATSTVSVVTDGSVISADKAIDSVFAISSVDYDGAKVSAIAIKYNVDMTGADVSVDDYQVGDYGIVAAKKLEAGKDPGAALKAYVNDKPEASATGGSGKGNYVIIEVNTDYQLSGSPSSYKMSVSVDVLQTSEIKANGVTIAPGTTPVKNYETVESVSSKGTASKNNYALDGTYSIADVDTYEIHTMDSTGKLKPFQAVNCFDEATGEYTDVTVPYSIYVPDDYDASKKYALVLHIGEAGCANDDPMITLTKSRAPLNLASDEMQDYMKEQGLGGLIVVCPQVPSGLRSTRDNWTTSAAVPAHWQFLDYITDVYSIDTNRIYGTGHSMGGMQILEMAAQRDNYFAGIWSIGCQWGNNYNKEVEYQGAAYYSSPADGTIIWTKDADGAPCDYRNWYNMVSDDNILITNCAGDAFSSGTWTELAYLYSDLCGIEFPKVEWNPLTTSAEKQNELLQGLLDTDSDNGFYWNAFVGGSHTSTWVYAHKLTVGYEWLLSQTRDTEMKREKLDLDKPFEWADVQLKTADRMLWQDPDNADNKVYYATGKSGSGTADYNSPVYVQSGTPATLPGWTVD